MLTFRIVAEPGGGGDDLIFEAAYVPVNTPVNGVALIVVVSARRSASWLWVPLIASLGEVTGFSET